MDEDIVIEGWQTITNAIQESVGEASTCWIGGTGDAVFNEVQAIKVCDNLEAWILEHFELKDKYK